MCTVCRWDFQFKGQGFSDLSLKQVLEVSPLFGAVVINLDYSISGACRGL